MIMINGEEGHHVERMSSSIEPMSSSILMRDIENAGVPQLQRAQSS
jgi:hypothetical protein